MKYRALTNLSLRQSPDKKSPKFKQWHERPAGTVFEPPKHMNVLRALERGIIEPLGGMMPVTEEEPAAAITEEVT